jgi:hypothetical protein
MLICIKVILKLAESPRSSTTSEERGRKESAAGDSGGDEKEI